MCSALMTMMQYCTFNAIPFSPFPRLDYNPGESRVTLGGFLHRHHWIYLYFDWEPLMVNLAPKMDPAPLLSLYRDGFGSSKCLEWTSTTPQARAFCGDSDRARNLAMFTVQKPNPSISSRGRCYCSPRLAVRLGFR
jgi:hypothetical protein